MIRPFTPKDMDQVLKIWLDASIQSHDFVNPEFWISKMADMRDLYLPCGTTFIYEDNGNVFGFVSLVEKTLAALFVLPERQNKGIGTQLMDTVKGMRSELILSVYKENKKSVSFYEKCGFRVSREQIDDHTCHPEYIMQWNSNKETPSD